ncbi:unnamed protein product [Meganyctiphanes norvegica]|uniref:folate gamma-glutamyl hydrolase n=1 Tax=Meganyctiphanes norvegica TaxID=48144 RepID=A0AAV2QVX0_MEGNR
MKMDPVKFLFYLFNIHLGYTSSQAINNRPIIGVLAQKPYSGMLDGLQDKNYTSYVTASYVKWLEAAGARVAPILTYQPYEYYVNITSSINGILLPGGESSITNSSGYGQAADIIYNQVLEINSGGTYLPLWGTCLGMEELLYLAAGHQDWLTPCSALNKADPLMLEEGFEQSRIFKDMPIDVLRSLYYYNSTINFHSFCMTKENMMESGMAQSFKMLTTNLDYQGLEYVSTMEHKELPIFGVQWHPEENPYEWADDEDHSNTPHSKEAILVSQYFGNFIVGQARLNNQTFASKEAEEGSLIYNHQPTYVYPWSPSSMQVYLFR